MNGVVIDLDRGPWIQTASGRFHVLDPQPTDIALEDITRALPRLCRWRGQAECFISVACHSRHVAWLVHYHFGHDEPEAILWALLHDAAEAYIGDFPRPLKYALPALVELEARVDQAIAAHFGLPWPMPEIIKQADTISLLVEARDWLGRPAWCEHEAKRLGIDLDAFEGWTPCITPTTAEWHFSHALTQAGLTHPG